MPIAGKRIVLDASVARSAGSGQIPGRRRAVFTSIQQRHLLTFSQECLAEWRKHGLAFAKSWLVEMVSQKKVIFLREIRDEDLRANLSRMASSMHREVPACERIRREMDKDAHLLEAARRSDLIIISLDEKARGYFRSAAVEIKEIRQVMWANPENEAEGVVT